MVRGIEIHTTDQCNLDCYYCCSKASRNDTHLSMEDFNTVLKVCKQLGYSFVLFSGGGEPTLNPAFNLYAQRVVQMGMKTALITNGTTMGEFKLSDIQFLLENAEWIRISLDACDRTAYRRIKGRDLFPDVLTLLDRIQRCGSRKAKIGIQVISSSGLPAYEGIKFADFACRFKIDYIFVKSLHFQKPRTDQLVAAWKLEEELDGIVSLDSYFHRERFKVLECYAPYYMAAVDAVGNLWGCCKLRGKQLLVGNLIHDDLTVLRNRLQAQIPVRTNEVCPANCLGIPPYPEVNSFGILLEGKDEFVVAVDLDGVLTSAGSSHHDDYPDLVPNTVAIQNLREAKGRGARVIIHTSRMNEDDVATRDWLNYHQVPYDQICYEKLRADVYIDDRNLRPDIEWGLELQRILDLHKLGGDLTSD